MSDQEVPAKVALNLSTTSGHYVLLSWYDEQGRWQELRLNPGQAQAVGSLGNLAQQSFEFPQGKASN